MICTLCLKATLFLRGSIVVKRKGQMTGHQTGIETVDRRESDGRR